jgi:metal-sulfur cluster biosynthetic enzyme
MRNEMGKVNEELVRNALRTVMDPELGGNLVDLNMVRNIHIQGSQVGVDLVLTMPGCPMAGYIIMSARKAVARLPGVEGVEVQLLAEPWQPPDSFDWSN